MTAGLEAALSHQEMPQQRAALVLSSPEGGTHCSVHPAVKLPGLSGYKNFCINFKSQPQIHVLSWVFEIQQVISTPQTKEIYCFLKGLANALWLLLTVCL